MVMLMVKGGHSWETKHSKPGAMEATAVDSEIQKVAKEAAVGWETIGEKNYLQTRREFDWNVRKPQLVGSPFFNTVVSHGILQALKGTWIGNVISYFCCMLASIFGSAEKTCSMLKQIVKDTRMYVEQFQIGVSHNKMEEATVKVIPTKIKKNQ